MRIVATLTTVFGTTLALLSSSAVLAFPLIRVRSSCDSNRMGFQRASKIALYATKPKQSKKQKKKTSGGGGGFGAAVKITDKTVSSDGKVRTVSGVTGSGTKPLRIAANTFDAIRKKYEAASTSDVYVRAPLNDPKTFWFVGKVNRRLDIDDEDLVGLSVPTEAEAVISQKRLILEYSKTKLRPQNLGGPFAKDLEIWTAPGDSEMDVVKNMITLVKIVGSIVDISETFAVADVGYNPEIYIGDEVKDGGLRVVRDEEGKPVKPVFDINPGAN